MKRKAFDPYWEPKWRKEAERRAREATAKPPKKTPGAKAKAAQAQ